MNVLCIVCIFLMFQKKLSFNVIKSQGVLKNGLPCIWKQKNGKFTYSIHSNWNEELQEVWKKVKSEEYSCCLFVLNLFLLLTWYVGTSSCMKIKLLGIQFWSTGNEDAIMWRQIPQFCTGDRLDEKHGGAFFIKSITMSLFNEIRREEAKVVWLL